MSVGLCFSSEFIWKLAVFEMRLFNSIKLAFLQTVNERIPTIKIFLVKIKRYQCLDTKNSRWLLFEKKIVKFKTIFVNSEFKLLSNSHKISRKTETKSQKLKICIESFNTKDSVKKNVVDYPLLKINNWFSQIIRHKFDVFV